MERSSVSEGRERDERLVLEEGDEDAERGGEDVVSAILTAVGCGRGD